jgi:hypothetical protein
LQFGARGCIKTVSIYQGNCYLIGTNLLRVRKLPTSSNLVQPPKACSNPDPNPNPA